MKILYLTYAFQHPKMRGSTRVYYFLKELSKRNQVTLLTLARSEIPSEAYQEMIDYTRMMVTIRMAPRPGWASAGFSRRFLRAWQERTALNQMSKKLKQLLCLDSYDVLLFHGKSAFSVIERFHELPIAIDFCDATSMRIQAEADAAHFPQKLWMALHCWQMRRIEKELIQKSPYLAFISCRDRDAILGADSQTEVIPNGVDLEYWRRRSNNIRPKRLIFTGVMDYKPNEDAAIYLITEILPRLIQSIPDVEICIAGRDPTPKLCKIARSWPQVTVTGFVQDMRDYLEQAAVFVAPLRYASGMQNKIQEAFAMGVPVISTPVAAAGMVPANGVKPPLYIADGSTQFSDCILQLLDNAPERARLSQEGRRFAEENFNWSLSAEKLEKLCQQAVLSRPVKETAGP